MNGFTNISVNRFCNTPLVQLVVLFLAYLCFLGTGRGISVSRFLRHLENNITKNVELSGGSDKARACQKFRIILEAGKTFGVLQSFR